MSWNGEIVIDLDSHIVERADRFYQGYIDPSYREAYQQLCDGVAQQAKAARRRHLALRDRLAARGHGMARERAADHRPGLSATARRKLLGQNALRLCPRLK